MWWKNGRLGNSQSNQVWSASLMIMCSANSWYIVAWMNASQEIGIKDKISPITSGIKTPSMLIEEKVMLQWSLHLTAQYIACCAEWTAALAWQVDRRTCIASKVTWPCTVSFLCLFRSYSDSEVPIITVHSKVHLACLFSWGMNGAISRFCWLVLKVSTPLLAPLLFTLLYVAHCSFVIPAGSLAPAAL